MAPRSFCSAPTLAHGLWQCNKVRKSCKRLWAPSLRTIRGRIIAVSETRRPKGGPLSSFATTRRQARHLDAVRLVRSRMPTLRTCSTWRPPLGTCARRGPCRQAERARCRIKVMTWFIWAHFEFPKLHAIFTNDELRERNHEKRSDVIMGMGPSWVTPPPAPHHDRAVWPTV